MKLKTSYQNKEFNQLIEPIITNEEYQKMKSCIHHGMNRYDHMIRVSYYSYKITKFLHLDYQSTARASALHDFFFDDISDSKTTRLLKHADCALQHSLEYYPLNALEQDIIQTHMFPFGAKIPRYLESWIVDLVDDVASVFEKTIVIKENMSLSFSMLSCMIWIMLKK